jgi:hypothetical protein
VERSFAEFDRLLNNDPLNLECVRFAKVMNKLTKEQPKHVMPAFATEGDEEADCRIQKRRQRFELLIVAQRHHWIHTSRPPHWHIRCQQCHRQYRPAAKPEWRRALQFEIEQKARRQWSRPKYY